MDGESFDVIVLGGGPGGSAAAKKLALGGKKVAMVSDELGGECLNYGCIPTKTFLWTAEMLQKFSHAADFGIETAAPHAVWKTMKTRRAGVVEKLKKGLKFTVEHAGVKIIEGRGRFINKNTIEISPAGAPTGNAQPYHLQASAFILATGSQPIFPSGFERNDRILTNHEILDLPNIPSSLLIIGSGAVGVEFASLFSALGTKVTIIEAGPRILRHEDAEVSAELARIFSRNGIEILTGTQATLEKAAAYEKVLVAAGRKPAPESLGLEAAGVTTGPKGIPVDEWYQTNAAGIFAIGDLAGKALLAYTAEREGEIAAAKILGKDSAPLNYSAVPNAIFCLPEIASVGLTEDKAKEQGLDYVAAKAAMSANAKALIIGSRDGLAKILIEKSSRKILGVHLICEKASELIAEASLAVGLGLTVEAWKQNLHPHPILGEAMAEAIKNL